MTISLNGTLSKQLDDGAYVDVTVKLGLITLFRKTLNLCEEAENSCPIAAGPVVLTDNWDMGTSGPPRV